MDALASLPVQVVAGTSGPFPAGRLSVPSNARAQDYLPLAGLMRRAALAVCHAGHGAAMAALAQGVPLVCPGIGARPGTDRHPGG